MTGLTMALRALGIDIDPVQVKQFVEVVMPAFVKGAQETLASVDNRLAALEKTVASVERSQAQTAAVLARAFPREFLREVEPNAQQRTGTDGD